MIGFIKEIRLSIAKHAQDLNIFSNNRNIPFDFETYEEVEAILTIAEKAIEKAIENHNNRRKLLRYNCVIKNIKL